LLLNAELAASQGFFRHTTVVVALEGRPYLDPAAKRLSIVDVGFDLDTRNRLIQTAAWVLEPAVIQGITDAAVIDLGAREAELLESAQKEIDSAKAELPSGVSAEVNFDGLRLADVRVTPEKLFLVVQAKGVLRAQFDDIPLGLNVVGR
jgi:hypothetical protein